MQSNQRWWYRDSEWNHKWGVASFVLVLYYVISAPYRVGFHTRDEDFFSSSVLVAWMILDYGCDVFFVVDMLLSALVFRTSRQLVCTRSELASQYFRTNGIVDLAGM